MVVDVVEHFEQVTVERSDPANVWSGISSQLRPSYRVS